ncbi:DUF4401 domain-containing protein [uncultured Cohaesibacter sp.]|uniref:DUF4401 domain-containing protein n=1 Tax=uncultured Cohaesibacter sp. TaxID=1002546 RepID=UPI0029C6F877|nr:DUF4401 domain-containing protein [uncultured Cohaesibacter sp.]
MSDNPTSFRFLMTAPGVLDWLAFLRDRGLAEKSQLNDIGRDILVLETGQAQETPIYLRALSAIGAVISGFLLLYLLFLFGLFDLDKTSLSINGLVFIGLSALLHAHGMRKTSLARDFYIQLSLTLLQVGKFALVAGLAQIVHDQFGLSWFWTISVILGLIVILSFLAFPSSIERFVSSFTFLASLWVCLLVEWPDHLKLAGFNLLLIGHMLALAAILRWPFVRQRLTSFYDALLLSLCLAIGLIQSFLSAGHQSWLDLPEQIEAVMGIGYRWSVQITMALALLALILWLAGRRGKLMREPVLATLLGLAALAIFSNAGILLALGLMILGFATHRQGHILLGLLFALFFGFLYYYLLDLTLLQKSAVLIASGALLLFGSAYIYWRGWHLPQQEKPSARRGTDAGEALS